jgi:hypothetical protein
VHPCTLVPGPAVDSTRTHARAHARTHAQSLLPPAGIIAFALPSPVWFTDSSKPGYARLGAINQESRQVFAAGGVPVIDTSLYCNEDTRELYADDIHQVNRYLCECSRWLRHLPSTILQYVAATTGCTPRATCRSAGGHAPCDMQDASASPVAYVCAYVCGYV